MDTEERFCLDRFPALVGRGIGKWREFALGFLCTGPIGVGEQSEIVGLGFEGARYEGSSVGLTSASGCLLSNGVGRIQSDIPLSFSLFADASILYAPRASL